MRRQDIEKTAAMVNAAGSTPPPGEKRFVGTIDCEPPMDDFRPDWTKFYTKTEAEKELPGFNFHGPGWYLHRNDTLLVVPVGRGQSKTWHHRSEEGEQFAFHVYNGRNPGAAFDLIAHAPVRVDER